MSRLVIHTDERGVPCTELLPVRRSRATNDFFGFILELRIDRRIDTKSSLGVKIFVVLRFQVFLYVKNEVRIFYFFLISDKFEIQTSKDDRTVIVSRNFPVFKQPASDEILTPGIVFQYVFVFSVSGKQASGFKIHFEDGGRNLDIVQEQQQLGIIQVDATGTDYVVRLEVLLIHVTDAETVSDIR